MDNELVRVVDAAYATLPETLWLRGLALSVRSALDRGLGVVATSYSIEPARKPKVCHVVQSGTIGLTKQALERAIREMPVSLASDAYAVRRVATASQAFGVPNPMAAPFVRQFARMNWQDCIGLVATDGSGYGVVLNIGLPQPARVSASFQRLWATAVHHMIAAVRIRTTKELEKRVKEAVHASEASRECIAGSTRSRAGQIALRQAARAIDRSRAGSSLTHEQAQKLWRDFVAGGWTLTDAFDSAGRRLLIARQQSRGSAPMEQLSKAEQSVTKLAAAGHSNKFIACELRCAEGTVATLLSRAARKLGVGSRVALIERWQWLCSM